jgi:hypothetical protein
VVLTPGPCLLWTESRRGDLDLEAEVGTDLVSLRGRREARPRALEILLLPCSLKLPPKRAKRKEKRLETQNNVMGLGLSPCNAFVYFTFIYLFIFGETGV